MECKHLGCIPCNRTEINGTGRCPPAASDGYDFKPVGCIVRHTGSLKDMAIIVWNDGQAQPPEGTILYIKTKS